MSRMSKWSETKLKKNEKMEIVVEIKTFRASLPLGQILKIDQCKLETCDELSGAQFL